MNRKRYFCMVLAFIMTVGLFLPAGGAAAAGADPSQESMFGNAAAPAAGDSDSYMLGTIFRTTVSGKITAIRVFGVEGESGTHLAYIWKNSSNEMIGGPYELSFTGEDQWVTYTLQPDEIVTVEGETDYTVGVSTPTGEGAQSDYACISGYFSNAGNNGENIFWPANAGVFAGGIVSARPISSFGSSNYFRDIVFVPDDVSAVFAEVNAAADAGEMIAALESGVLGLELDKYSESTEYPALKGYLALDGAEKAGVASFVLGQRPEGGFTSRGQIRSLLNEAVNTLLLGKWQAAFDAVNAASTVEEFTQALGSPSLGLDLSAYAMLTPQQKSDVTEELFRARPAGGFADMAELNQALAQAVSKSITDAGYAQESLFSDVDVMGSLTTDKWGCNYGTVFTTAVPGFITAIKVFGLEGAAGSHTAYIWENDSGNVVGGPYTISYTGSNQWVTYELPRMIPVPEAGKTYTVMVATVDDSEPVPILREGTARAGNNGASLYYPANAGVFGPKGTSRPVVSWRYNYLRDVVFVPSAVNPAVTGVNEATDKAGIRATLEQFPQWLDLSAYGQLGNAAKDNIAQKLLEEKAGGYTKVKEIQQIIDAEAAVFIDAATAAAIAQVNGAEAAELEAALKAPILGLSFTFYDTLTNTQKTAALENITASRPAGGYGDTADIQSALDLEVKNILYSRLIKQGQDFFPIGVWMQSTDPAVMQAYKEIGVNTYVSLSSGSFNEDLYNKLKQYGMKAVVEQNKYARDNIQKAEETVLAWLHSDEPDLVRFTADWWPLVPASPVEVQQRYAAIKTNNQTIPVFMNLSKGIAYPEFNGRGVDAGQTYMYPAYAKGADILSFDIYTVNDGHDLSCIAKGVDNLIRYSDGKQPVWAFVETTKFDQGNKGRPTPAQVKAQVWMALVHGAQGIEYFCHQFSPNFIEAGPLDESYADIKTMIAGINGQITKLAPVLNSPTTRGYASVTSSNAAVSIDTMTKEYNGSKYIFAVGMNNDATTGTFHVASGTRVEVLGEDRTLSVQNGQFSDDFDPYGVHLYKITETKGPETIPPAPAAAAAGAEGSTVEKGTITAKPELDKDGTASVKISVADLKKALEQLGTSQGAVNTVQITIEKVSGAKEYAVWLPAEVLTTGENEQNLQVVTPIGSFTVPPNVFNPAGAAGIKEIDFSLSAADLQELSGDMEAAAAGRPAIALKISANGKELQPDIWKGVIKVAVSYEPTAEEQKDMEHLVMLYADEQGAVRLLASGRYDASAGNMTFTAQCSGRYGIAFVKKTFGDITKSWAKKEIEVLASRGILTAVSSGTYGLKENITRGEFVKLLVNTMDLHGEFDTNFEDVEKTDPFYTQLGIARALGVVRAAEANKFKPSEAISRQDMMDMIASALKVSGKRTSGDTDGILDRFADQSSVSVYAREGVAVAVKEGIIQGDGTRLFPQDPVTREMSAVVLYRLYYR